jgi:hypothetical protein
LIVGLLAGDESLLAMARTAVERAFGAIEATSDVWPFEMTHYYEDELGPSIVRQFVTLVEPFPLDRLAEAKLTTNELEAWISQEMKRPAGLRPVNIDPGYITLGSLVLATTKSRAHRIYLGSGIFAEVTLCFESGQWRSWPWTYPDYASPTYHAFFTDVRNRLKQRRRDPNSDTATGSHS